MTKFESLFPPGRRSAILITVLLFGFGILCQLPILTVHFPGLDDSGYLFDGVRLVEQGTLMPLGSGFFFDVRC